MSIFDPVQQFVDEKVWSLMPLPTRSTLVVSRLSEGGPQTTIEQSWMSSDVVQVLPMRELRLQDLAAALSNMQHA